MSWKWHISTLFKHTHESRISSLWFWCFNNFHQLQRGKFSPKLSCRLSQNSEYWAWSIVRVWRSKRWRKIDANNIKLSSSSPSSASGEFMSLCLYWNKDTMMSSDLHPLLFDRVYFLSLSQWQEVASLVQPCKKVLGQSLPPLVSTCRYNHWCINVCDLIHSGHVNELIPASCWGSSSSRPFSSLDL